MKILYIEDDENIALPVIKVLQRKGYSVDHSPDGRKGGAIALSDEYDCILLDLNLPGMDGITIARHLREAGSQVPVLMLTARESLDSKLEGFDAGTDDYLTKPFEMTELLARINALVRRKYSERNPMLSVGELQFAPGRNLLLEPEAGVEIALSNKESGVLEYLVLNKGRVVSPEELLTHVWDSNINEFTGTVKTHIKTLRKKLGRSAERINTIKGKGYVYE